MTQQLQQIIEAAWENRANLSPKSAPAARTLPGGSARRCVAAAPVLLRDGRHVHVARPTPEPPLAHVATVEVVAGEGGIGVPLAETLAHFREERGGVDHRDAMAAQLAPPDALVFRIKRFAHSTMLLVDR